MLIKTNMSNDHHDQLFTDMQSPQDNNKINDLQSEKIEQEKSIETEEDEEGLYSSEIENSKSKMRGKDLSSREIVEELDRYIIAQPKAKRALAIAVRSRKRRMQLPLWLRKEVTPKNILMRGPSGVGKTEAVRRIANITHCPFIGVPATKFTEVGYIGGDVDSIIKGLVDTAFKRLREEEIEKSMHQVREIAEDRILQAVLANHKQNSSDEMEAGESEDSPLQSLYRKRLQDGLLDEEEITIEVSNQGVGVEIMGPPGMEEMTSQLQNVMQSLNAGRMRSHRLKVKDAIKLVQQEEADKLLNEEELKHKAIEWVEEYGIVFIDEIDKVCRRGDISGSDVSREGVQRDLLPLIEGSSVSTKYGMVRTDHILFITAGAFQSGQKPSDLIPELQGRLPIRVELYPLTAKDFERILTERHASLIAQYKALFETEGVNIQFSEEAIRRIAEIAYLTNEKIENIGARRLYTVMERLLEELSFEASDLVDKEVTIDLTYVNEKLASLFEDEESTHYIL